MTEEKLKHIAQHIAQWMYGHLVIACNVDIATAKEAASAAANKATQSLTQDLGLIPAITLKRFEVLNKDLKDLTPKDLEAE